MVEEGQAIPMSNVCPQLVQCGSPVHHPVVSANQQCTNCWLLCESCWSDVTDEAQE